MKTYEIFDNANQHNKLNGNTEFKNNNEDKNDKSTMNNRKVTLITNKVPNDIKLGFKHDSNASQAMQPTTEIIDDKCNKSLNATSANKRYTIENFLQSNASNVAVAAAETARNGFLAAAAAAQQYTPFNIFSPTYLKDMFLAAQLISRGKRLTTKSKKQKQNQKNTFQSKNNCSKTSKLKALRMLTPKEHSRVRTIASSVK